MSLLTDFWAIFAADVNDPPAPSLSQAADLLQIEAPTLSQQEAEDWFDAVAVEYERLDIITLPTYTQLRVSVDSDETAANELFKALQASITNLPETIVVNTALELQAFTLEEADIPSQITTIETARDLLSDAVLIEAYNAGIRERQQRLIEVQQILGIQ